MADLQAKFREAWSQALLGLNAAEGEAEKVLTRLADAAGLTPEDVKHHAREFGERLTQQRREVERAIDDGVRRAAAQFKVPTRDEIAALRKRIDEIADRLEVLAQERSRKE
jgi:polyhydroxyalkanoate synthesis regulator phasin